MGHERVGLLPKTQKWRDIVAQIASLDATLSEEDIADIAGQTIKNVRDRFRFIQEDESVKKAFAYIVTLSVASRSENPQEELAKYGINLPENPKLLSFTKASQIWIGKTQGSLEYKQIAQSAVIDTIGTWYSQNKETQGSLFAELESPYDVWRKASNGAGFCELARIYFGKFTERYLNYFLEREASSALGNITRRNEFSENLTNYIDKISKHSFETAKITQSFAAGWFNKNAKEGLPTDQQIKGFLSHSFGKLRDELTREAS